jgi:Na+-translocating ferredoxin:NAD+ oxidoreductase RnfG subunit
MKLTLSGALYRNIWYRLSRLSIVLLIVVVAVCIYLQVATTMTQRQIEKQQAILNQRNAELNQLLSDAIFSKLEMVRYLKDSLRQMPRSVHIPKVISIVDALQSLDS